MPENQDSFDSPWKEALELYLRPFLELGFPKVAAGIDWTKPIDFLDKELEEVVRDAELGKQRVDKLVKVCRLDGAEEWVLIHVEIQSQADYELPQRLYQYHHRIKDRYGARTVTLAVLADERANWRPDHFEESLWGCRVRFEYPICKLVDWRERLEELEGSDNPIATVIAAHLRTQETKDKPEERKRSKWQLTRRLYERGYVKKDILELYRLIDWLMALPEELAIEFRHELMDFEKERSMPYVTSIERLGRQEGRLATLREGILDILETRFGPVEQGLREKIESIEDEQRLKELHRRAVVVEDIETFLRELG